MPYIGMFSDDEVNKAIQKTAEGLEAGKIRLVLHADTDGTVYVSAVKKLGEHVSIEAAVVMKGFDPKTIKGQAEIIAEF